MSAADRARSKSASTSPSKADSRAKSGRAGSQADVSRRRVSPWIKAFVAFHIVAITIWAVPDPPEQFLNNPSSWHVDTSSLAAGSRSLNYGLRLFSSMYLKSSIVRLYLLPTGFWQYWDMFAPNPADTDVWCDAVVKYTDGTQKIYQYPRMYDLSIPQKYEEERYRKYYERAHLDKYEYLWPQFGLVIAHRMDNPANPPVEVDLRRHWLVVAPPGQPQPTQYSSYTYFKYIVDPSKLATERQGLWTGE